MNDLSPFKLTLVAGLVVLVLSAGIVGIFGGFQQSAGYLALVGTIAVPALLNLLRSEANAKQLTESHQENQSAIATLQTNQSSLEQKINQLKS